MAGNLAQDKHLSQHCFLCIQLPEDVLRLVKNAAVDCSLKQLSFFDGDKLREAGKISLGIFCVWDGPGGMAQTLISELKSDDATKSKPIVLIVPERMKVDAKFIKRTKLEHVIKLPHDSFRIAMLVYTFLHPEENHEVCDDEDDFDIVVKTVRLEDLPKPRYVNDEYVLNGVGNAIRRYHDERRKLKEATESKNVFLMDRVIAFHPDPNSSGGLAHHLQRFGCASVLAESNISRLFSALYREQVRIVFAWYCTGDEGTPQLIREINETRNLNRIVLIVNVPGEDSGREFRESHPELLVDGVIEYHKHSGDFRRDVDAILARVTKPDHPAEAVYALRQHFRHRRFGLSAVPPSLEKATSVLNLLKSNSAMAYWAAAELVFHSVLVKDKATALRVAADLHKRYPSTLDPSIVLCVAKGLNEGVRPASEWIVEEAIQHRALNLEKCVVVSQMLTKWKAVAPLKKFLENWATRDDLACDDQFYFYLSCLYGLANEAKLWRSYAKLAVTKNPLRFEYLAHLSMIFRWEDMARKAAECWRLCGDLPVLQNGDLVRRIGEHLLGSGRGDESHALLTTFTRRNPDHQAVGSLLQKTREIA